MLKNISLPNLRQIFTFPQFNNSVVSPSAAQTPVSPFAPYQMSVSDSNQLASQVNGGAEIPIPSSPPRNDIPDSEKIFQRRFLAFDQKPTPYPSYLRILKQVSAFIILFLSAVVIIGAISDYTRYEVSTNIDIRRNPPPYHVTLCFDIADILIQSKLPIELQTKISAFKSKSRSEYIQLSNAEISKELTVDQMNAMTPSLVQMISEIRIKDQGSVSVDNKNVINFFKGLSKCFAINLSNFNWFKIFESNLLIKLHDKNLVSVKLYIHYDNLINGKRRSYKLVNLARASRVTLSYRIVRRMFLPPPYVTNCKYYAHDEGDANDNKPFDSRSAAIDMCVSNKTLSATNPLGVPDYVIQPSNSTIKFISGSEDATINSVISDAEKECYDTYQRSDCIDDTVFIYETEREQISSDMESVDYEPEIVISNPINDFTTIQYEPLKTLADEIFAVSGAIGFLVAAFLLISYLSKVVLRVCNKK